MATSQGFGERLRLALAGRKKVDFARAIRVRPHQLSRYLRGQIPDPLVLLRIARELGLTVDYLLLGRSEHEAVAEALDLYQRQRGAFDDLDREARESIRLCADLYRSGDRDVRHHLTGQLRLLARMLKAQQPPHPAHEHPEMGEVAAHERFRRKVPLLSPVAAGRWRPVHDPYPVGVGEEMIETDLPGHHLYALRVEGDSMEPGFHDGMVIFVDPDQEAGQRDYVVIKRTSEEAVCFKQLVMMEDGRKFLHSLNPAYPDMEMEEGDEPRGRVVARG